MINVSFRNDIEVFQGHLAAPNALLFYLRLFSIPKYQIEGKI